MARILIFSDVHGNLEALEAVFAHARALPRPDQVWCLGDLVGYGPEPGPCIDRIRDGFEGLPIVCIRGNHDEGVIRVSKNERLSEGSGISASIRESWDWTARQLSPEHLSYLDQLPLSYVVQGLPQSVLLVHAAPPDDLETYLLAVRTIEARLGQLHQRLCCFGHTHLPCYFECDLASSQVKPRLLRQPGQPIALQGDRILLNPGSVGQPRWGILSDGEMVTNPLFQAASPSPYPRRLEGMPRATYFWLELVGDQITVTFHDVAYDVQATIAKLKALQTAPDRLQVPQRWLNRLSTGLR